MLISARTPSISACEGVAPWACERTKFSVDAVSTVLAGSILGEEVFRLLGIIEEKFRTVGIIEIEIVEGTIDGEVAVVGEIVGTESGADDEGVLVVTDADGASVAGTIDREVAVVG